MFKKKKNNLLVLSTANGTFNLILDKIISYNVEMVNNDLKLDIISVGNLHTTWYAKTTNEMLDIQELLGKLDKHFGG